MPVLIAEAGTTADVTVVAGAPVSLVLVPTAYSALPAGARATVSWKGTGSKLSQIAVLGITSPGTILDAPGVFQIDKTAGAFSVERN